MAGTDATGCREEQGRREEIDRCLGETLVQGWSEAEVGAFSRLAHWLTETEDGRVAAAAFLEAWDATSAQEEDEAIGQWGAEFLRRMKALQGSFEGTFEENGAIVPVEALGVAVAG